MVEITRGEIQVVRGATSYALIVRVGADLAKNVIQVHAVDAAGRKVVGKALRRDQFVAWCAQLPAGCMVAMEACGGAHHWARKLRSMGLDARMIAANFVTPYRMEGKSGKNDMTDAAAICEAACRPNMRFVPIKTTQQQGLMSIHRLREGFKEERTACINRIRAVLVEAGLAVAKSPKVLRAVLADLIEDAENELSDEARGCACTPPSCTGAHWTSTCTGVIAAWGCTCAAARMPSARPRSTALASSGHRPSSPGWVISSSSKAARSSVPGWASCRARTPPAASPAWGASPSEATPTCARCWSRARSPR